MESKLVQYVKILKAQQNANNGFTTPSTTLSTQVVNVLKRSIRRQRTNSLDKRYAR